MGNLYLFCALIVTGLVAIFAPRAGLILGIGLFLLGLLPAGWFLFARVVSGTPGAESDGMMMTLGAFYLSAPGIMLAVFSLLAATLGLDR